VISNDEALSFVRLYRGPGVALFGLGMGSPERILMVPTAYPDSSISLSWQKSGILVGVNLLLCEETAPVVSLSLKQQPKSEPEKLNLALSGMSYDSEAALSSACPQPTIAVSGASPIVDYAFADIVRVTADSLGELTPIGMDMNLGLGRIPTDILARVWIKEWILAANERDFAALLLSNEWLGKDSTQMLVFLKSSRTWTELRLGGAATFPRAVNDWLVGTELLANPNNNRKAGYGYPPVATGRVLLYNPASGHTVIDSLGIDSEILYARDQGVLYRVADSLFTAVVAGDRLAERSLIASDPSLSCVHWAFPGD